MRLYLICLLSSGHSPQNIISKIDIEYTCIHLSLLSVFLKYFLVHLTIRVEEGNAEAAKGDKIS